MAGEDWQNNSNEKESSAANWVLDFLNSADEPADTPVIEQPADDPEVAFCEEYDGLKTYQNSVAKYPQATASENRSLLREWRDYASESAMTRLIEGNLHIVVRLARYYASFYPEVDEQDLITMGYTGLKSAVEHYDSGEATAFNTYASYWVKQALQRYIVKNSSVVYIPGKTRFLLQRVESYFREYKIKVNSFSDLSKEQIVHLTQYLQITDRALATLFKIPLAKQLDLHSSYLQKGSRTTSLADFCKQIRDDSSDQFTESENKAITEKLFNAISQLDARESMIIKLRYGLFSIPDSLTLEEVSQKLGRTRERVRQIEQSSLKKLKDILAKDYENYVETFEPTYTASFGDYEIITPSPEDLLQVIADILDFEITPLSLGEIRQHLKLAYPGRSVSDALLRRLLRSSAFSQIITNTGRSLWQLSSNDQKLNGGESTTSADVKVLEKVMDFEENIDLFLEKTGDLGILHMGDFENDAEDEDLADEVEDDFGSDMGTNNPADDIIKMFSL